MMTYYGDYVIWCKFVGTFDLVEMYILLILPLIHIVMYHPGFAKYVSSQITISHEVFCTFLFRRQFSIRSYNHKIQVYFPIGL